MGIFGQEVRREFIARPDSAKGQILFKWPDTNIRKLTQLTVEQDELAVFFRDGRIQGTIQPGRVTLDSSEIPFLGILVDAARVPWTACGPKNCVHNGHTATSVSTPAASPTTLRM